MSDEPADERAVVYPSMWLPTMTWFVPRNYAFVVFIVSIFVVWLTAIFFSRPGLGWLLGAATCLLLWIVGAIASYYDPEFFEVRVCELFEIGKTKGDSGNDEYLA